MWLCFFGVNVTFLGFLIRPTKLSYRWDKLLLLGKFRWFDRLFCGTNRKDDKIIRFYCIHLFSLSLCNKNSLTYHTGCLTFSGLIVRERKGKLFRACWFERSSWIFPYANYIYYWRNFSFTGILESKSHPIDNFLGFFCTVKLLVILKWLYYFLLFY